ncbi:MAG: FAD-dependent oxidoreductase [Ectothiorhodospiraceae bacterium]|nr:FAD-dependent oxidoreductase [Ectothiorhodospiraceae bacterium]
MPMRIAVVGAGVAGLQCAGLLSRAGAELTVFDKGRGPGGRLSTARGDGWQADQGAQYFTARSKEFTEALRDWCTQGVAGPWPGRLVWLGDGEPEPVSDEQQRYVGTPRMTAISRYLAQGLDVRAAVRVGAIRREGAGVRLLDTGGADLGRYDRVVVAVPSPQAEPLLRDVAPELARSASEAVMEGCWSVVIRASGLQGLPFDAAFIRQRPLRWVARDTSKPGRPEGMVWVLHADAGWTQAHMERPAEWVADQLLGCFRELLPGANGALEMLRVHRWRYASSPAPLEQGCLLDETGRIGACGDWCHGNRVEGAWLSGQALATRMLG